MKYAVIAPHRPRTDHGRAGVFLLQQDRSRPNQHLDYGAVRFADFAGGSTNRLRQLGADFERAGIPVTLEADLWSARWHKLVWNIPFNGLFVVLNANTAELMAHPDTRALAEVLMREVVDGAAACGRTIAESFAQKMLADTAKMKPYRTSMQLDHDAGRPMEVEAICGHPPPRRPSRRCPCGACAYAGACQGGCWLQRRHGTECYQALWHMPQALTTAGTAVCLGLAAASCAPNSQAGAAPPVAAQPAPVPPPAPAAKPDTREMEVLQGSSIMWYASQTPGHRVLAWNQVEAGLKTALPDDPGAKFFLRYIHGESAREIPALVREIEEALQTRQRSLCLIGLAWRALLERCLEGSATPTAHGDPHGGVAAWPGCARNHRGGVAQGNLRPEARSISAAAKRLPPVLPVESRPHGA